MNDLQIRSAEPHDVPHLLSLIGQLAAHAQLEHLLVADESLLSESLFGARPAAEALVAERRSRVVGMAVFFHTFSTFLARPGLYLEDLFVSEPERNQGIGRALLRAVAQIACDRNCGRLEWAVLDWNEPAIRLYQSLGAEPLEDSTIYRMTGGSMAAMAGRTG